MQIPEMWVVSQMERFISVSSERNIRDHLWRWSTCFGRTGRAQRLPFYFRCVLHIKFAVPLFFTFDKPRSRDGAVVRALASHQCRPGSIPVPGVICGLSLLLVFYSAPRGFSPGTPLFPSPQKPTFLNSNSILECTDISARVFVNSWRSVGKQIILTFSFYIWQTGSLLYLSSLR